MSNKLAIERTFTKEFLLTAKSTKELVKRLKVKINLAGHLYVTSPLIPALSAGPLGGRRLIKEERTARHTNGARSLF